MMEPNSRNRQTEEDVIDLARVLHYMIQGTKLYWIKGLVLVLVLTVAGFAYSKLTYVPAYVSSASVIVTDSITAEQTTSDLTLAGQMGTTFSYIVNSDMLRNVIASDLGVEEVTSSISATAVEGPNLLTISVSDPDPQTSYDVMLSVLENYPAISDYVLGATKIEIIQQPQLPTTPANWGSTGRTTVLCALAGIVIFAGLMALYALTRKTAGTPDDIREATGVEFLTNVPRVTVKKRSGKGSERILVTQKNINQGFVEAFRNLANQIEEDSEKEKEKRSVYMFTSAVAGEGKTTVALNTAIVLAKRGKRVLLIDADLRSASLSEQVRLGEADKNLQTFLSGKSAWNESVYCYRRNSLFVLPARQVSDSAEATRVLSLRNNKKLMSYARRDFDYVLIDTAPLGILADAANIAQLSDGAILVVRQDYAQLSDIAETNDRISEAGCRLVGFVMNQSNGNAGSYGYGYGYG